MARRMADSANTTDFINMDVILYNEHRTFYKHEPPMTKRLPEKAPPN